MKIETIHQRDQWNNLLRDLPTAHILQTWEWGEFKQITTGWTPQRFAYRDDAGKIVAAASSLTRRMGPVKVVYVPKGPALDYQNVAVLEAVLAHLQQVARGAIWLKIDPDLPVATGIPAEETADPERPYLTDPIGTALRESLQRRGWRFSPDQVQFRNTLVLDLSLSEDDLLKQMSQGTRRKIRQAEKAGVIVREADLQSADLEILYRLYEQTGDRQEFLIRPLDYYRQAWLAFTRAGLGKALIAEVEGEPVSGLVLFHFGKKVWYFYGMSSPLHRDAQPNYALQWHAIRWAKAQGYALYDWWGAPNQFIESDPMWGVYRFKDGFGGIVVRHIGAWDYVPIPLLYTLYEGVMPQILKLLRRK